MTSSRPSGTAPFALSVLDNAHTAVGQSVGKAFDEVIALAQPADRRGYRRFWMSEHHAMPGAATSSPQLMLARLVGETNQIRLGAGGVMLPNHAPLLIAEQFGMLEALAPGRIDLGLGRAPGTDHATAAALRRQQVGAAVEELHRSENDLAGALLNLSDQQKVDHEIFYVARDIAAWSQEHVRVRPVADERPADRAEHPRNPSGSGVASGLSTTRVETAPVCARSDAFSVMTSVLSAGDHDLCRGLQGTAV